MVELASIIILGILAQWVAWRLKVPAILPLILIGLAVGPFSTLYTHDGHKWLNPIFDATQGGGLFPGENLFYFVELAIGIILFEGGLTLKRNEIKAIGPIIGKLISVGSAVTFFGAAIITYFLIGLSWPLSFLFAGLIIVTGPTVIAPILRNIPLKKDVANILKWEGILIDPIGALAAVLVYEFIASGVTGGHGGHGDGSFTAEAFKHFLTLTLEGLALGTIAAFAYRELVRRHWIPHYLLNVVTLAIVLAVFVGSGLLVADSGLLTIVVMGTVLANIDLPNMEEILYFKESLAVLLISMLFILLAANINLNELEGLLEWKYALLFLSIILIIRPLGVFLSTMNSPLVLNEKLFVSWVGPRGIVAAGIASLFGNKLVAFNVEAKALGEAIPFAGAELITPLVFMIVLGTVLLNATTAGLVAKLLGVRITKSNGILFIGANTAARIISKYLGDLGRRVILVDTNVQNIQKAQDQGSIAIQADVYSDQMKDNTEFNDMGYLFAFTGSAVVNDYVLNKYGEQYGENGAYRLVNEEEIATVTTVEDSLLSPSHDYIRMSEVARDYPKMNEMNVNSREEFDAGLAELNSLSNSIALFLKQNEDDIVMLTEVNAATEIAEGAQIVYLGKEI